MINNEKLKKAVEEVGDGLSSKFPQIQFYLKPYYCGMGYVGLEILLDDVYFDHQVKEFEDYYIKKYENKFFAHKVTKFGEKDVIKPMEILYVGKDGPYKPLGD